MKTGLINWLAYLKTKKKFLAIVSFLIILFFGAFYDSPKKRVNTIGSPSPLPSFSSKIAVSVGDAKIPLDKSDSPKGYSFNRFDSLTSIIGLSWNGNKIVYATKDGIFKLWKNEPIVTSGINYIDFNSRGQAVYAANNDYFFFNSSNNSNSKIGSNLNEAQINTNATYVLYRTTGSMNLLSLSNTDIKKLKLEGNSVFSFGWIESKDFFYLYNLKLKEISLYDTDLKLINTIKTEKKGDFLGFNSDGNKYVTYQNDTLTVNDVSTNSSMVVELDKGSSPFVYWTSASDFLLIETLERGNLGLFADYLWSVNINGQTSFLTNSFPIPNKLNTKIKIFINQDKNTVLFSENNGRMWTLSMKPSYITTYNEQGVSLYKITQYGDE